MRERRGEKEDRYEKRGKNELVEKVKELEKNLERKERQKRRKNIIIRGIEVKEKKIREAVMEVLERIGIKGGIEEAKKLGKREGNLETIWVRLESEEQKREVMEKKNKLKGRKEKIREDWTWKERKMRWNLEQIARKEMGKGRRVWIGYGKIKIDEKWWKWDEEEAVLTDGRGMIRKESLEDSLGEEKEM